MPKNVTSSIHLNILWVVSSYKIIKDKIMEGSHYSMSDVLMSSIDIVLIFSSFTPMSLTNTRESNDCVKCYIKVKGKIVQNGFIYFNVKCDIKVKGISSKKNSFIFKENIISCKSILDKMRVSSGHLIFRQNFLIFLVIRRFNAWVLKF